MLAFGRIPKVIPVVMARTLMHRSSGLGDVVKCIVLPLLLEQSRKVCPVSLSVVWIAVLLQKYFCVGCCSHGVTCLKAYAVAVT